MTGNKIYSSFLFLFLLLCGATVFAQEESEIVIKPTIGAGAGMLTFYGDISRSQKENSSVVSRVAYELRVTQKLNTWLDLNFYFLTGKMGANEKSLTRNLNFESKITAGGLNLSYNFHHLLKEDRIAEPYLSLGFESFEFLSKTDLWDANGNEYHYWDDGGIRNIPQNSSDLENAIRLQRDFKYESDIRTLNLDSFGKYPERSFAIPVGAGVNLRVSERMNFRIGTAMHFSMTDYIDGVTAQSKGDRKGDAKNDRFLFTSFSLSYNLSSKDDENADEDFSDIDALFNADTDGDGIKDIDDKCAGTPLGVPVDLNGCPLDDDKDGVPNNTDLELATPAGSPVDSNGVALTDEQFEAIYNKYLASDQGEEFDTIYKQYIGEKQTATFTKRYYVKVGEYSGDIPEDVANMILSIPDVQTWQEGNRTVITVGDYEKLPDAVKRALQLTEEGIEDASVVTKDNKGGLRDVSKEGVDVQAGAISDQPGQLVYRVQVGAFSKKLSKNIFEGIPDLVVFPGEDGLTRYYSGSFASYKEAAGRKVDLVSSGFDGAFIVAFKDGKKVPLKNGKPVGEKGKKDKTTEEDASGETDAENRGTVKKEFIKFRVQIGAYKEDVPSAVLAKYAELGDVEQKTAPDGVTLYTSGLFTSFEAAQNHKNSLAQKGITDAFVIGEFKGKIITAQEAVDLLEGK